MRALDELRRDALAYLRAHNTVSLATNGADGPWAASVFYVNLGLGLYFLSEPTARHSRNVEANPLIGATINEDYKDWREIKGTQMADLRRGAEQSRGSWASWTPRRAGDF